MSTYDHDGDGVVDNDENQAPVKGIQMMVITDVLMRLVTLND